MRRQVVISALVVLWMCGCFPAKWLVRESASGPFPGRWAVFEDEPVAGKIWIGTSDATPPTFDRGDVESLKRWIEAKYGLKTSDLTVSTFRTFEDGRWQVGFQQHFDSAVIKDAGIFLNFDRSNRLTYFHETFAHEPPAGRPPHPPDPSKFVADAVRPVLGKDRSLVDVVEVSEPILVNEQGRMRWALEGFVETRRVGFSKIITIRTIVDLENRHVVRLYDPFHSADPEANVFIPTPLQQCTFAEFRNIVPQIPYEKKNLNRLDSGAVVPTGEYETPVDLDSFGNVRWSACDHSGNNCDFHFVLFGNEQQFAEVLSYYTITRIQEHVQDLRFMTLANRKIKVDVFAKAGQELSWYLNNASGEGDLYFGEAPMNGRLVATDAKVIAHEYGHAIQAAQVLDRMDAMGDPGGISEGFADYVALSFFVNDEKSDTCRACFGAFMNDGDCYRSMQARIGTYSAGHNPVEAHALGELWTKALWLTLQSVHAGTIANGNLIIARDIVDTGVLHGHENVDPRGSSPDMPAMARFTLAAVRDQPKTQTSFDDFCNGFVTQKIITARDCTAIKTLPIVVPP